MNRARPPAMSFFQSNRKSGESEWLVKSSEIVNNQNISRVGVETPIKIGLESSPEEDYGEFSSEEKNSVVPDDPAVDYGYDDDYIGDINYTLYARRDVYSIQGWTVFVSERRSCAGFSVPGLTICERLSLVLRALYGQNWKIRFWAPRNN